MKKYYLVAGEASGDLHASSLVKEINKLDKDAVFRGFGGDKMMHEGVDVVQHFKDIAFMGFREVLLNLKTIKRAMSFCKNDIKNYKPDILILIDYPGFNKRIAKYAKKKGFKVIYYISPQFWAQKEKRVKSFVKYVDQIIVILPFEKEFYAKHGIEVEFCGHPLPDVVDLFQKNPTLLSSLNIEGKDIIAVLPGSRKQEIENLVPLIHQIAGKMPEYLFLIAASKHIDTRLYGEIELASNIRLVHDQTYDILSVAKAGIIKSGTSTLEAALFRLPMVVCYKTTLLNYLISRNLIKVKFIALVNLILNKEVVKELIQHDYNEVLLKKELLRLLEDKNYRENMLKEYALLRELLYGKDASRRAAESIIKKNTN